MSNLLPDCGVLSSPSTARPTIAGRRLSQHLSSGSLTAAEPSAKLGAGVAVSFYKSPKPSTCTPRSSPSSRPSPHSRFSRSRPSGNINRGVGHGIKKPKLKAKNKKASNPAKVSVRRLKQVKPPPRLAEHRNPAARRLPSAADSPAGTTKKRHQLSSPGLSLLEGPESGSEFIPSAGSESSGKFFTSRARAAATVQITKNVVLSASYGDISLTQRTGSAGLKKNIGVTSTEQPDLTAASARPKTSAVTTAVFQDLSSLNTNSSRPKPTRFPSSPSPRKTLAAQQAKQLNTDKENQVVNSATVTTNGVRSSPRRTPLLPVGSSDLLASPAKAQPSPKKTSTVRLLNMNGADVAASPGKRKFSATEQDETPCTRSSPRRLSNRHSPCASPNITPSKSKREISPRKLVLIKSTPTKTHVTNVQTRFSPRKTVTLSPSKIAKRNVVIEMVHQSPNSKSNESTPTEKFDDHVTPSKSQNSTSAEPCNGSVASSPRRLMLRDSPLRNKNSPAPTSRTPVKSFESPLKSSATLGKSTGTPPKILTPSKGSRSNKSTPQKIVSTPTRREHSTGLDHPSDETSSSQASSNSPAVNGNPKQLYFPVFDPDKRKSHIKHSKQTSVRAPGVRGSLGDSEQRVLDAGQKEFGARQCPLCSLVYEVADPDDEKLHTQHHNRVVTALTYKAWKKECQVSNMNSRGGRCIMICPSDPQYCWRKVSEVLTVVDEELGFSENSIVTGSGRDKWVILYVESGKVAGCLVAEKIETANRIVPPERRPDGTLQESTDPLDSQLLCCSTEPVPVKFGISRVWVRNDCRRMGIARQLVDSFRGNVQAYTYLKMDEFAFSDPTTNGVRFAQNYTKKEDFLVYRHSV